ncbi:MAG: hypothetical protein CGEMS_0255 [Candidatus Campylobacter infans]|nr:MAG: hypothetical protein CGEMS_0255 [Candidatus Campylobacter infans]
MTISPISVRELSQISQNITAKSLKFISSKASTKSAPRLEYTQTPSPKGRVKIPKSVSAKIKKASILDKF